MSTAPLIKSDLDTLAAPGSACPRCTQHHENEWHFPTPCHPKLNLTVPSYSKDTGVLSLKCFICGEVISTIKVAAD